MLLGAGMGKRFWAEAATTAVKLINKCPSSSINGDTPDSRWFGRHGTYDDLRTFGCKAFAHVKQGKLEARALKCVMIGYQQGVKGYRLWCIEPGRGKVIVSRDVIFSETEMPFRSTSDAGKEKVETSEFEVEAEENQQQQKEEISASESSQEPQPPTPQSWKLARDRARRAVKPSTKYSDAEFLFFCLLVAEEVEYSEPCSYEEAVESKDHQKWMQAMIEEIDSLLKNGTWVLVERPDGRRVVSCKWIFKRKLEAAGTEKVRFKARLVARGFT